MKDKLNEVQNPIQEGAASQQGEEVSDDMAALAAGGVQAGDIIDYHYLRMQELKELKQKHESRKKDYL